MAKKKYFLANGTPLKLPATPLGEGGEAYVYKINATQVAKIYKEADDTCFTSLPGNQAIQAIHIAKERIRLYNKKLKYNKIDPIRRIVNFYWNVLTIDE